MKSVAKVVEGAQEREVWQAQLYAHGRMHLMLFGVFAHLMIPRSGHSESYQAFGQYSYTNFNLDGSSHTTINSPFCVFVEGEKAYVRIDFGGDRYAEWSYDGTNSYHLVDNPDPQFPGDPRAAATLSEDEFPNSAPWCLRALWLGLASGHFLGDVNNEPMLVPWGHHAMRGALSYRWEMEKFSEPPLLPKRIVFRASPALWEREQGLRIAKDTKGSPFREGFVGGRLEVQEATNLEGLVIPTVLALWRYRSGVSEGALLEFTRVSVTNLTKHEIVRFVPRIERPTDVQDMRDSTAAMPRFGITYTLTNDNWPARSDPRRLAMVEAHKPAYEQWRQRMAWKAANSEEHSAYNRGVVGSVLAFSLLSPPLLYAYWKMKVRKTKKKGHMYEE